MVFRVAKLERDDHLLNQAHFVAQQIFKDHPDNVQALLNRQATRSSSLCLCLMKLAQSIP